MNNSFYSIFLFICFSITVVPHSLVGKGKQPKKSISDERIIEGTLENPRSRRFATAFPDLIIENGRRRIARQNRRNERAQETALILTAALIRRQAADLRQARQERQTSTANRPRPLPLPDLAAFDRQPINPTPTPPAIVRANRHTATPTTVSIFNITNAGSFPDFEGLN